MWVHVVPSWYLSGLSVSLPCETGTWTLDPAQTQLHHVSLHMTTIATHSRACVAGWKCKRWCGLPTGLWQLQAVGSARCLAVCQPEGLQPARTGGVCQQPEQQSSNCTERLHVVVVQRNGEHQGYQRWWWLASSDHLGERPRWRTWLLSCQHGQRLPGSRVPALNRLLQLRQEDPRACTIQPRCVRMHWHSAQAELCYHRWLVGASPVHLPRWSAAVALCSYHFVHSPHVVLSISLSPCRASAHVRHEPV